MIQRRRIYEKSAPSRDAQKIYIVCEGKEREKEYFEFFQGISTNLQLIIIPPEGGKTDPVKLMEQAIKVFLSDCPEHRLDESEKDLVWFAIDTDTWRAKSKSWQAFVVSKMKVRYTQCGILLKVIRVLKHGCTTMYMRRNQRY